MSIIFFGTPSFSVPSLKALVDAGEDVSAVVTRPDKRRGRGGILPSLVKEYAIKNSIRVLQPASMKDNEFLEELKSINPEFIVVVAFGRILTNSILDVPKKYPINLHASLLPKYRGASPIAWAIINGEKETGVTTMVISERLDEGDMLLQEAVKIEEDDTTVSLARKLSGKGAGLLIETIAGVRNGKVKPRPQAGEPSFAPPFKKEDGRVDWSKSARRIFDFQRGMHPWPGAFCLIEGERVRLVKIKPVEGKGVPGVIKEAVGDSILIGAGDGFVSVLELQPEGKKDMAARAYMQGRSIKAGSKVG